MIDPWRNDKWKGKTEALGEKTSPRTNLSNTNITKAMLGLNLSFCGQKVMNRLELNAFYILRM